jgi:hypothetical protein
MMSRIKPTRAARRLTPMPATHPRLAWAVSASEGATTTTTPGFETSTMYLPLSLAVNPRDPS